ncbi:MAG: RHS repeat-associated core domain-containing protein [Flavobacteriales bacterium]
MAVIDDRTGAAPPVLYLMRRGSTQSQLVAIRLDDLDNVQPIPLHTYSDFGAGTMPEMQVSPDGQYLAVSSRVTNSGSIFPALETYKIILFRIDPDHLGLTEVGTLAVPNTVRISSLDFSPESAYLYFVRTISEEGHRLYRVAVPGFSAMEAVNTGARITEVRRIKGDRMLLTNVTAINGGQRNIYALHTPNAATGTLAGASAGLIWSFNSTSPYITTALSPHLALQPLIIHTENPVYTRTVDLKRYELTDHLGNVRAVVSDRLLADYDVTTNADPTNLRARVLGRSDYYPFGSLLPGRNYSSTTDTYRFGFNGMPSDEEVAGERNSYDFGARLYDPRVGRWLSLDPLLQEYPSIGPYTFVMNMPIAARDPDGKRVWLVNQKAVKAFRALISSYGNEGQVARAMNIRADFNTGKVSSYDVNPMTERQFSRNLRDAGVDLSSKDRANAYSTYLAIVDAEEVQVEVVEAATVSTVRTPGSPGTGIVGSDTRLNSNPGLNQFKSDLSELPNGATSAIIDEAVRPEDGVGRYAPSSTGDGFAKYASAPDLNDTDIGIKETVLIDGSGNTDAQNGQILERALATP